MASTTMAPGGAIAPPQGMSGDMKFVGMFQIIYGALCCLTIIGALIGVPAIIAGLRLRESGEAYAAYSGGDGSALGRAFTGQASFFKIIKILMIIALVLIVLDIVLMIAMGGLAVFMNR